MRKKPAITVNIIPHMERIYGKDPSKWPTKTSLAETLNMETNTVNSWLNERVTGTTFDVLGKWCDFFGVTPGEILVKKKRRNDNQWRLSI